MKPKTHMRPILFNYLINALNSKRIWNPLFFPPTAAEGSVVMLEDIQGDFCEVGDMFSKKCIPYFKFFR